MREKNLLLKVDYYINPAESILSSKRVLDEKAMTNAAHDSHSRKMGKAPQRTIS